MLGLKNRVLLSLLSVVILAPALMAIIVADPISLDFGDLALLRSGDETGLIRTFVEARVAIINRGAMPVDISAVAVSGSPHFELRKHGCTILPPAGTCTVLVRYGPRDAGGHAGTLTVRASDGSEALVPLWGDAEIFSWVGSLFEAPTLSFGAATAGQTRERILGVVNDTTGSLSATVTLSGDPCFAADIPDPGILEPAAEFALAITCTYEGKPGVRTSLCTFDLPPPMLPVVRALQIPLMATVVPSIQPLASISLRAEEIPIDGTDSFCAMARARTSGTGVARRLLLPTVTGGRPSLKVCAIRYREAVSPPALSAWRNVDLTASLGLGDELGGITPILAARKKDREPLAPLAARLKRCAFVLSGGNALVIEPRDRDIARTVPLAAGNTHRKIMCPSDLWQSRAYAIRRKKTEPCLITYRAKREGALRLLRRKRCMLLSEILGARPSAVRAMDAVAVRKKDATWEEKLVMVARYAAPAGDDAEDERRLFLLGRRANHVDAQVTLEPRYGPVSMLGAFSYLGQPDTGGAHHAVACYLGRQGGRLLRYRAARGGAKDAWNYTNNPTRFQVNTGRLLSMRRMAGGKPGRQSRHDHIGNFLVVGRRGISLMDCSQSMRRKVGGLRSDGAILAASRPRHTLSGEEQPLYLLERRKDGGRVVTAYRVGRYSAPDGKKKERPVALTGDCEFVCEIAPGETGGWVTLEAHAFDPDGTPLVYSWTAPGIEFDDPTSPTPTGYFPQGETTVYLVVRDGPADDPDTLESEPCLVRVTVTEQNAALCGDANSDGTMDISDPIFILAYLFVSGTPPSPLSAADVNGSGEVDIADAVYILSHLFAGGPPPVCRT